MTQKKIFVIMGSTGEYSDRREWSVRAVSSKEAAISFVDQAEKIANEQEAIKYPPSGDTNWEHQPVSALDPNFKMDYTGTSYFYYEVDLFDE